MFCTEERSRILIDMVHLTHCRPANYLFILLCLITMASCRTKNVCMAVSNNGKPDYYNQKHNRNIQNSDNGSLQTATTGLKPSQIDKLNPDMKKFRKKKEKTKAKRPRHKKYQPIF
jgi:hypothetical protein